MTSPPQNAGSPGVAHLTASSSGGGIRTGSSRRSMSSAAPVEGGNPASDSDIMRAARRRWASGVAVVTINLQNGDNPGYRGITVSAFNVVSLDPAIVLVCIAKDGEMAQLMARSELFAVSVLDRSQEVVADRFAGFGPLPDRRFTGVAFRLAPSGCPILDSALAWFDCRTRDHIDGGDHVIVLGAASAVGIGPETDDPLVSFDGGYRRLEGV